VQEGETIQFRFETKSVNINTDILHWWYDGGKIKNNIQHMCELTLYTPVYEYTCMTLAGRHN